MAKCLRCGADASWLQGRVPDETPAEAAELAALRERVAELEAQLRCVETNLRKGMSKSVQRLQAQTIAETMRARPSAGGG